jgi:hypothetical protein
MNATVEIHIDSRGLTWQFYNEDHHLLAEWSMKRDPKGGFRGTQKGEITDALWKAQKDFIDPGYDLTPLIERLEDDQESTNLCDVCDGLQELEDQ